MASQLSGSSTSNPSQIGKQKSKAYLSSVAIQSDATKYRQKYKELKRRVREMEKENDQLQIVSLKIKQNIQRLQLERAILYERLESETSSSPSTKPTQQSNHPTPSSPSKTAPETEYDIGLELENLT
ncbi:hypothetical protein MPSI1_002998 [Malassezia psittaci]|uniref:INO80 complex subunit F domain-containing protein n=1 Tax=Malassezia psittaci TaxID=1821823 RepID=A0AAF0F6Z8_9BASI|nr:hypothetical protein MPSI1_002998 [Malassezia psittaci]